MFLNSTLHYSREAILGFTPNQLRVGKRVLSLFHTSSAGSMSIVATVTKSYWVISRLLAGYTVSFFPQKDFDIYGLKALQVLSINVSVKKCITSVKRQDLLILLRHVPMDDPTAQSFKLFFLFGHGRR